VPDLPESFVRAIREGRFHDAATDGWLHARWTDKKDGLARALLILAAAHHHASTGNLEGARIKLGRAVRYLERLPLDPYAALLIEHAREALGALADRRKLPPLPTGFR
jgi:predicted metal-dependent hydrolase